jgi:hypothetical protein
MKVPVIIWARQAVFGVLNRPDSHLVVFSDVQGTSPTLELSAAHQVRCAIPPSAFLVASPSVHTCQAWVSLRWAQVELWNSKLAQATLWFSVGEVRQVCHHISGRHWASSEAWTPPSASRSIVGSLIRACSPTLWVSDSQSSSFSYSYPSDPWETSDTLTSRFPSPSATSSDRS